MTDSQDKQFDASGASQEQTQQPKPSIGVTPAYSAEEQKAKAARQGLVQRGSEQLAARVRARGDALRENEQARTSQQVAHLTNNTSMQAMIDVLPQPSASAPLLALINGSPRKHTCTSLLDIIEFGAREAGVRTARFEMYNKKINPCIGCGACSTTGECVFASKRGINGHEVDDYVELIRLIDSCAGLAMVAPVYFSGPTAQLKALYDRFQPYWCRKYLLGKGFAPRRQSELFVVGSGGDPHGYDPMVTISRSCLQIAGFELEKIYNFVGYLAPADAPRKPSGEEQTDTNARNISKAREQFEQQLEFRHKALEAGRAFGRSLIAEAQNKKA